MTLHLTKSFPRLWSLHKGVAMIVTDLHGNWDIYQRYRDRFVDLHARGHADYIIFTGDMIHRAPVSPDYSLDIVLDVLQLQARYGDAVIYMCGNHELPHRYGFVLSKGLIEYTPAFEAALNRSPHRGAILDLFDRLPFYIRTAAGVSITHAGASSATVEQINSYNLFTWQHDRLVAWADNHMYEPDRATLRSGYARLSGVESYATLVQHYLGITDSNDERYDDLLRAMFVTSHPDFQTLREALFTRCEQEYGTQLYAQLLLTLLNHLSVEYVPQRFLITGHLTTPQGYTCVAEQQLRIASAQHAVPRETGCYLLLDTSQPMQRIEELVRSVCRISDAD
jgi:predicted MPP superfamily phosphohydrolase